MTTELVPQQSTALTNHGGAAGGDMLPTQDRTVASSVASAVTEARAAIMLAKEFPRNEPNVFQGLMRSCQRTSFAEVVAYRFPRGGSEITGPSVKLAREMARQWGNIQYGLEVIIDTPETRKIRAWAWDVETNSRTFAEDEFAKLIQRKNKQTKKTEWVQPDERDLRELTNRRGAVLVRNCLLQLMPPDFVDDAMMTARQTLEEDVARDPDREVKRLVAAFGQIGVPVAELEEWAECKLKQLRPAQIVELREIFVSVRDGNSRWSEHLGRDTAPKSRDTRTLDDLRQQAGDKAPAKPVDPPAQAAEKPKSKLATRRDDELASPDDMDRIRAVANRRGYGDDEVDQVCRIKCGVPMESLPASRVQDVIDELLAPN